jgi:hypothetical protein
MTTTKLSDKQVAAIMMHKAAISVIEATSYLAVADQALHDIIEEVVLDEPQGPDVAAAKAVRKILDTYEALIRTSTIAMVDVVFGVPFSDAFFEQAVQQIKDDLGDNVEDILGELMEAPSCLPVFSDGSFEITLED